jgi:hypothetical protein
MKKPMLLMGIALIIPLPLLASTFTVNSATDATDVNPGDGICEATASGGDCSVRAAVMETNALDGADTIEIPAGTFTLTIDGTDDAAEFGDLDIITSELTINGAGADVSILDAGGIDRFFHTAGSIVSLSDLTIRNGVTDADSNAGGAIVMNSAFQNPNELMLTRVHLLNNSAKLGGALRATPETVIRIEDSVFQGNSTIDVGGGNRIGAAIYCQTCQMTVVSSTISGNGDDFSGKVVNVDNDGQLNFLNSTISGNTGGGVRSQNGNVLIKFSTLVDNGGQNLSFFSFDDTHVFQVGGSVLQSTDTDNCQTGDLPASLGYNVVGDSSCSFGGTGDLQETGAALGPLADNGGATQSHLPGAGSPVLNHVPPGACTDLDGAPLALDQRGSPRPVGSQCDAGSVEADVAADPLIFEDGFETETAE